MSNRKTNKCFVEQERCLAMVRGRNAEREGGRGEPAAACGVSVRLGKVILNLQYKRFLRCGENNSCHWPRQPLQWTFNLLKNREKKAAVEEASDFGGRPDGSHCSRVQSTCLCLFFQAHLASRV